MTRYEVLRHDPCVAMRMSLADAFRRMPHNILREAARHVVD